jgi:hypothetical protein
MITESDRFGAYLTCLMCGNEVHIIDPKSESWDDTGKPRGTYRKS